MKDILQLHNDRKAVASKLRSCKPSSSRSTLIRLQCLFHEVIHLAIGAVVKHPDNCSGLEFLMDRLADTLAFAYHQKMKPWKSLRY